MEMMEMMMMEMMMEMMMLTTTTTTKSIRTRGRGGGQERRGKQKLIFSGRPSISNDFGSSEKFRPFSRVSSDAIARHASSFISSSSSSSSIVAHVKKSQETSGRELGGV
eukprot:751433-Hanusia_phi.AAC.1